MSSGTTKSSVNSEGSLAATPTSTDRSLERANSASKRIDIECVPIIVVDKRLYGIQIKQSTPKPSKRVTRVNIFLAETEGASDGLNHPLVSRDFANAKCHCYILVKNDYLNR